MKYKGLILFIAVMSVLLFTLITTVNIPIIDDFWVLHNVTQIDHATTFNHKLVLLFEPHSLGFGDAFFNQTEHRYVVMKLLMLLQLKIFHTINLQFFTFLSGISLIASLYFLLKFITNNTNYNTDIILLISIFYLTPMYFMNLFWMLGFNNHLTVLLGFASLYFFTFEKSIPFILGCILLIISLFVSHGGIIFIFTSGIYLLLKKQYPYFFVFFIIFAFFLLIDFYSLSKYAIINSENNKLGLRAIFSIFPLAVLLGSITINLKLAFVTGFIFMAFQLYLLKKKYYLKNPEVFCLQLYIYATCLGLALNRWQFGANYFLNTRYKYFSMLILLTFLLAFYEYYFSLFSKYKYLLSTILILYFLGGSILAYKSAFNKKEKILTGFNYYLNNKVGGLYVFDETMYDTSNKQNKQAAIIMDSLMYNNYILLK
jgi:hypothetical protein